MSAGQLAAGLTGLVVAINRGVPYDVPFLHGDPDRVQRDFVFLGTGLSANPPMFAIQAAATVLLARRPAEGATRVLGALGAVMVGGYLAERVVRHRLTPGGWDVVETPVAAAGLELAAVMALLGLRRRDG